MKKMNEEKSQHIFVQIVGHLAIYGQTRVKISHLRIIAILFMYGRFLLSCRLAIHKSLGSLSQIKKKKLLKIKITTTAKPNQLKKIKESLPEAIAVTSTIFLSLNLVLLIWIQYQLYSIYTCIFKIFMYIYSYFLIYAYYQLKLFYIHKNLNSLINPNRYLLYIYTYQSNFLRL